MSEPDRPYPRGDDKPGALDSLTEGDLLGDISVPSCCVTVDNALSAGPRQRRPIQ